MKTVLKVTNIVKQYGNYRAVDRVSFTLRKGQILGLLGANGAGKTTTIHMLVGVTLLNGGTIEYFEKDFNKHRLESLQRINFTSSFNTLQGRISVRENLKVFAGLYNIENANKKISELLEYFEIEELAPKRYWDLSAGQKSRVNLIKAFINDPEIVLMDEPTASLDPDIADKVLSLILDFKKQRGMSILYTSHNMEEITRICDEVLFLDKGKIVAQDTPLGLTKRITFSKLKLTFDGKRESVEKFAKSEKYRHAFLRDNIIELSLKEEKIPEAIFDIRKKAGVFITDIEIVKPDMEDVFLQIARRT